MKIWTKDFEPSINHQKEMVIATTTRNQNLEKTILKGVEDYDQITQNLTEFLSNLIISNPLDSSVTTNVANLINTSIKCQFGSTHPIGSKFRMNHLRPKDEKEQL